MTELSVVICAHNSATRLSSCLEHLASQVEVDRPWEVLVVNNASTDETTSTAVASWSRPDVPLRVVDEPRLGLANARACARASSQASIVLFIDDDNLAPPDLVSETLREFDRHPTMAILGFATRAVHLDDPPDWFSAIGSGWAVGEQGHGDVTESRGHVWGAGMAIRREVWQALVDDGWRPLIAGRSGTSLVSGSDTELCLALRLRGWRIHARSDLHIGHVIPPARLTWDYALRLHAGLGESEAWLAIYRDALSRRNATYAHVVATAKGVVAAAVGPRRANAGDLTGLRRIRRASRGRTVLKQNAALLRARRSATLRARRP